MSEAKAATGRIVTFSLVSHTNAGKTTLARTLLGSDIGEVRDAPHVTEFAAMYPLVKSAQGDELRLWDTPGFGDSARLVRRLRGRGNALGWFLSEVWDRWRDRAFWSSQRVLQHVQADSDLLLYLVNASESPAAAGYVAAEMELLGWVGKPVLVLLNQLGAPRDTADEAAEVQAWRDHLARWPLVREVLPLDAFARCWVHELTLMHAAQRALASVPAVAASAGDAVADAADADSAAAAMARLAAAWQHEGEARFGAAMQVLADGLSRVACTREALQAAGGWSERLRRLGAALGQAVGNAAAPGDDARPEVVAQARLAAALDAEVRASTAALLQIHHLKGDAQREILQRVDGQFALRQRVPEGRAAVLGGAVTGALAGLKADIVSGGLTMGGGLLAGALLGALGAAGVARGINVVRGTGQGFVAWSDDALQGATQAALLRYLAVAHFGRGRGDWSQGEAPPHWQATVAQVLAQPAAPGEATPQQALSALWSQRSARVDQPDNVPALATAVRPLLQAATREVLRRLYGAGVNGEVSAASTAAQAAATA